MQKCCLVYCKNNTKKNHFAEKKLLIKNLRKKFNVKAKNLSEVVNQSFLSFFLYILKSQIFDIQKMSVVKKKQN